jgi:hypothetical protein
VHERPYEQGDDGALPQPPRRSSQPHAMPAMTTMVVDARGLDPRMGTSSSAVGHCARAREGAGSAWRRQRATTVDLLPKDEDRK